MSQKEINRVRDAKYMDIAPLSAGFLSLSLSQLTRDVRVIINILKAHLIEIQCLEDQNHEINNIEEEVEIEIGDEIEVEIDAEGVAILREVAVGEETDHALSKEQNLEEIDLIVEKDVHREGEDHQEKEDTLQNQLGGKKDFNQKKKISLLKGQIQLIKNDLKSNQKNGKFQGNNLKKIRKSKEMKANLNAQTQGLEQLAEKN
jgi:hypothetical protein